MPGLESITTVQLIERRQMDLAAELDRLSPILAQMYFGSLRVFADRANPDAIALAAHGIREMMEKLPESLKNVPQRAPVGDLAQKVGRLRYCWTAVRVRRLAGRLRSLPS